jgi:hypothetical protein
MLQSKFTALMKSVMARAASTALPAAPPDAPAADATGSGPRSSG